MRKSYNPYFEPCINHSSPVQLNLQVPLRPAHATHLWGGLHCFWLDVHNLEYLVARYDHLRKAEQSQ